MFGFKSKIKKWWSGFDIKPQPPTKTEEMYNKGCYLLQIGEDSAAIKIFDEILDFCPWHENSLISLSHLYTNYGYFKAAKRMCRQAITYHTDNAKFYFQLGYVYAQEKNKKKAIKYYEKALELEDSDKTKYFLNLEQGNDIETPPKEYITGLFDYYAPTYEMELIESLAYCAPTSMVKLISDKFPDKKDLSSVLDLGCGTGLWGKSLSDKFKIIEFQGVDLSKEMLSKAKEKNIYTDLVQEDIVNFLSKTDKNYEIIGAIDVFVYIGNLQKVMQLAYEHLKPNGCFCFTTEHHNGEDYILTSTGRYKHTVDYINKLSAMIGFTIVAIQNASVRQERGVPVSGDLVLLQKA